MSNPIPYLVLTLAPSSVAQERPRAFARGILGRKEALRRKEHLEFLYPDLVVLALPHDKAVELYDVYA